MQSGKQEKRDAEIDENLRTVFNETLEEGIPDRFKDLLEQLKQQDQGQGSLK